MTNGEAAQTDGGAVIFPAVKKDDNREILSAPKAAKEVSIEEKPVKSNLDERFARLKKSLRKRSASIL